MHTRLHSSLDFSFKVALVHTVVLLAVDVR